MSAQPTEIESIPPWVWRVGWVVVFGSLMTILDSTIVNVALDTLHTRLHSSLTEIQWVITGYTLSLATVIPLTGWGARRIGAKRVYIASLVVFTAGSALCGLAGSATMLIVFRVLQGAGGGMMMPAGQMILAGAAGPRRMGRVISVTGLPAFLAPALGPVVGGLILQYASWRWMFLINVPIGIPALVLARRVLPNTLEHGARRKLDVPGLLLMATGIPALTYGLAEVGATGTFGATQVIVPILIGVALIAAFVWHCLGAPAPLLDMHLFRRSTYSSAALVTFFLSTAVFGSLVLMPLYYQQARHLNTIDTGLLLGPQGIGMIVTTPFVGRLADRFGGGPLVVAGLSINVLATIPLALIGAHTSYLWLSFVLFIRGIGLQCSFMPAFVAAFASLKRSELPDAAPQLNVVMRVGGSIGVAVLTVVLARALVSHSHTPAGVAGAFGTSFWWSLVLTAVALPAGYALWRSERRAREAGDATTTAEPVQSEYVTEAPA